jgi:hypothetical protein
MVGVLDNGSDSGHEWVDASSSATDLDSNLADAQSETGNMHGKTHKTSLPGDKKLRDITRKSSESSGPELLRLSKFVANSRHLTACPAHGSAVDNEPAVRSNIHTNDTVDNANHFAEMANNSSKVEGSAELDPVELASPNQVSGETCITDWSLLKLRSLSVGVHRLEATRRQSIDLRDLKDKGAASQAVADSPGRLSQVSASGRLTLELAQRLNMLDAKSGHQLAQAQPQDGSEQWAGPRKLFAEEVRCTDVVFT